MELRTVERFKKRTVWFHWIHSIAFLILLITGARLFIQGTGDIVSGGSPRIIHCIAAALFMGGPTVYFAFNRAMLVRFVKEILRWGRGDLKWLRAAPDYYFGGLEENMPQQGYLNTGQKMWQVIVCGTGIVFLITGGIMLFRHLVAPGLFQWSLFVHDIAFIVVSTMFIVHLYMGSIHPRMTESLRSMWNGKISPIYAKRHYGKWYEEINKGEQG